MDTRQFKSFDWVQESIKSGELVLESGSEVAVIGGGPAGSFFSYFVLDMAGRIGVDLKVDIYEPRNFTMPAPAGCNMCGGIISETLVQNLAADGINLSPKVIQRAIDSYMLHTDVGSVRIDTPNQERRIGAVTRGPGPKDIKEIKWESFDGYLLGLALGKGANLINDRITAAKFVNGRPEIKPRRGSLKSYDLLAVAVGVNSSALRLFEDMDFGYQHPETSKTFICEYFLGSEKINDVLGSSMHVFLLNIPRLEFAAIIPKGEYATVCLLGDDIDDELIQAFLNSPAVKGMMPEDWLVENRSCRCMPCLNTKGPAKPFTDRIVFIGDCGVTRLYKDGIGAAYRTAKAAASTVVFRGISEEDFRKYYMPACDTISADNQIGKLTFIITELIQKFSFARRGLIKMTKDERWMDGHKRRMSMVMWDLFTGSAPYREIFVRTLHPIFVGRFIWNLVVSMIPRNVSRAKSS